VIENQLFCLILSMDVFFREMLSDSFLEQLRLMDYSDLG
jgi:hypothetical protein